MERNNGHLHILIRYLWIQVFADVLLQEGTLEDGGDRGTVPGVHLINDMSVFICVKMNTEERHFSNYPLNSLVFFHPITKHTFATVSLTLSL